MPGAILIPLGEIPRRYAELDPDSELIMQCKTGARSGRAADYLRTVGFKRVMNLKGGILDWIDKVDPSQPKY
jgi:adenylyltransferase/sulfurtransferase